MLPLNSRAKLRAFSSTTSFTETFTNAWNRTTRFSRSHQASSISPSSPLRASN
jgi:hypothetical protein